MTHPLRWLALVLVLVLAAAKSAEAAGSLIVNSGDDLSYIRDLPDDVASVVGFRKLGYHYHRFGLFTLDLWRWSGEFAIYDKMPLATSTDPRSSTDPLDAVAAHEQLAADHAEALARARAKYGSLALPGEPYIPLTDDEVELFGGASVPWSYHLPLGLVVVFGLGELAIITRTRRTLKITLSVGAAMFAVALLFWAKGLGQASLIPAALGVHHTLGSWLALRRAEAPEDEVAAADPAPSTDSASSHEQAHAIRPSPPNVETDPFRAPPQPPPIVVTRTESRAAAAPIVPDDRAEGPKLLD